VREASQDLPLFFYTPWVINMKLLPRRLSTRSRNRQNAGCRPRILANAATACCVCLLLGLVLPAQEHSPVHKLTYQSGKEKVQAALYVPAGKGPFPAVIVVHGDFGPVRWVHQHAQRLAAKGYVCLAIDLYRGELPKDLEEAHILERGLPEDRVQRDMQAAVAVLSARPEVKKDKLGIIGFDMGGGHALDAGIRDRRLRAVVNCYGRLTTDAKLLSGLHAPVLGLFAGKDEGISAATINQFRTAMKKADKRASLHVYANCETGFLDPASPYASRPPAKEDVADAWTRIETFLAAELK
jgi:carboxymethylenebutenolidase